MTSLRRKYQGRVDYSKEPVASSPIVAAEPPDAVGVKAPEPLENDAVRAAAAAAIKQRLEETQRADHLQHEAANHSTQFANDPDNQTLHVAVSDPLEDDFERKIAHLPERSKGWFRAKPELLRDPEANARMQYCRQIAIRETGGEEGPYCDRMEELLGLRASARNGAPAARQQSTAPVSAPPSRDSLSLANGRPVNGPMRLTGEESQLARTLGLTEDQYRAGKKRMLAEKEAGLHEHG